MSEEVKEGRREKGEGRKEGARGLRPKGQQDPRAKAAASVVPAVSLCMELLKWFLPLLHKLPRSHRFSLGDRMESRLLDILEDLIKATYDRRERASALAQANLNLDIVRHLLRLSMELGLVGSKRYEHGSRLLVGLGEQVGGWLRASRSLATS